MELFRVQPNSSQPGRSVIGSCPADTAVTAVTADTADTADTANELQSY